MCTMMGTPAPSAASRVRRRTSRSSPPGIPASMRTLRPTITSRLSSTVRTMASGSMYARSASSLETVMPGLETLRRAYTRVRAGAAT